MRLTPTISVRRVLFIFLVYTSVFILSSCAQSASSQELDPGEQTTATLSPSPTATIPTATVTPFLPAAATPTYIPTPSATPIPPPRFETDTLYRGVLPVSYIEDTCQYYYDRWNPDNAAPGTVVLPVMYHGISPNGPRGQDNVTVSTRYFQESIEKAHQLGFETITMQELVNFLHHNAYIPPRSMLLIIDDRRLGTVREHFLPVLNKYDWTLTMAYITGVMNEQEWNQVKDMLSTGRTEIQAHGFLHNGETYITQWTSEEIIRQEIYAPIDAFEEHLGYRPIAYIWPGGNYNQLSVDVADEAGYEVGFTVFARGPLMYNWIPLGEADRAVNNPLLVLPRYWSTTLYKNLNYVVELSKAAQAQAESQKVQEIDWYRTNCPDYPPLSFRLDTRGLEDFER